jgi:hypothetical protein
MLFQAVNTSTFLSLLIVLGNAAPSLHGIVVAVSGSPCVVKGEGSPHEMSSSSILVRQRAFSRIDDALSGKDLLACGAADGVEEDEDCEVPDLKGAVI